MSTVSKNTDQARDRFCIINTLASGIVLLSLLITACGSDGGDSPVEQPTPVVQPTTNPESTPLPTPTTPEVPAEMTPIEMLFTEIKQVAGVPLIAVNQKITSGQTLTAIEEDCLGDYEPSFGQLAVLIDCATPSIVNDSILTVSLARFDDTGGCQSSLGNQSVDDCTLVSAKMDFPIQWTSNDAETIQSINSSRIAGGVQPIAGTNIQYNLDSSGLVVLRDTSDVTGSFECQIIITNAELVSADGQSQQCQAEIGRTITRMNELRTAEN